MDREKENYIISENESNTMNDEKTNVNAEGEMDAPHINGYYSELRKKLDDGMIYTANKSSDEESQTINFVPCQALIRDKELELMNKDKSVVMYRYGHISDRKDFINELIQSIISTLYEMESYYDGYASGDTDKRKEFITSLADAFSILDEMRSIAGVSKIHVDGHRTALEHEKGTFTNHLFLIEKYTIDEKDEGDK